MDGIDTLLFDWDGTLIESAENSFAAFQKALQEFGIPLEYEVYKTIYSPNWYSMYAALQLPREKWKAADDFWMHYYGQGVVHLVRGGKHALAELSSRGYCLGIVTSGSRSRVLREMGSLGVADVIGAVVCNEDVRNKKPHPEGLERGMQLLNRQPGACCYVGDSPDDIEMGRRAHVRTIAIPGGYPGSKKLADANPDFWFGSIDQLLKHFSDLR